MDSFRARALAFAPTLPFVLYETYSSSLSFCISLILSASVAFFAILFHYSRQVWYLYAAQVWRFVMRKSIWSKMGEKKISTHSNEQARKHEFARTESSILCYILLCRTLSKWMRGSEFYNFILKRSAIDWIYCVFIERTVAISGDDDTQRHKPVASGSWAPILLIMLVVLYPVTCTRYLTLYFEISHSIHLIPSREKISSQCFLNRNFAKKLVHMAAETK